MAHNLFISARRRAGKVTAVEDIDQIDAEWNRLASHDNGEQMLDALKGCLEGLTERARWSLEMRFRDRLSRGDIADALEITEHGAKNLMQRAKKQLRECIEGKLK